MHIVIGLVVGSMLGILAGSAAVQFVTPPTITVQANKSPPSRSRRPAISISDRFVYDDAKKPGANAGLFL